MKGLRVAVTLSLLVTSLVALSADKKPEIISGLVTKVLDGDTIVVDRTQTVRLANIEAPELENETKKGQPFGPEAKLYLTSLILYSQVTIAVSDIDQHGSYIGIVTTPKEPNTSVNAKMVSA